MRSNTEIQIIPQHKQEQNGIQTFTYFKVQNIPPEILQMINPGQNGQKEANQSVCNFYHEVFTKIKSIDNINILSSIQKVKNKQFHDNTFFILTHEDQTWEVRKLFYEMSCQDYQGASNKTMFFIYQDAKIKDTNLILRLVKPKRKYQKNNNQEFMLFHIFSQKRTKNEQSFFIQNIEKQAYIKQGPSKSSSLSSESQMKKPVASQKKGEQDQNEIDENSKKEERNPNEQSSDYEKQKNSKIKSHLLTDSSSYDQSLNNEEESQSDYIPKSEIQRKQQSSSKQQQQNNQQQSMDSEESESESLSESESSVQSPDYQPLSHVHSEWSSKRQTRQKKQKKELIQNEKNTSKNKLKEQNLKRQNSILRQTEESYSSQDTNEKQPSKKRNVDQGQDDNQNPPKIEEQTTLQNINQENNLSEQFFECQQQKFINKDSIVNQNQQFQYKKQQHHLRQSANLNQPLIEDITEQELLKEQQKMNKLREQHHNNPFHNQQQNNNSNPVHFNNPEKQVNKKKENLVQEANQQPQRNGVNNEPNERPQRDQIDNEEEQKQMNNIPSNYYQEQQQQQRVNFQQDNNVRQQIKQESFYQSGEIQPKREVNDSMFQQYQPFRNNNTSYLNSIMNNMQNIKQENNEAGSFSVQDEYIRSILLENYMIKHEIIESAKREEISNIRQSQLKIQLLDEKQNVLQRDSVLFQLQKNSGRSNENPYLID